MKKRGPTGPSSFLTPDEVAKVEVVVKGHARDYALFVMGTNTAFRASDILGLNVCDVRDKAELRVKERKTGKVRIVPLNAKVQRALKPLCFERGDKEPVFIGEKRKTRLTVCSLSRLWGDWCAAAEVGHKGGSHVGRKTWARSNWERGTRIEILSRALNHGSPSVTFAYLMIGDDELRELYQTEV